MNWPQLASIPVLAFAVACSWGVITDFRRYGYLTNDKGRTALDYPEHVGIGAVTAFLWALGLWLSGLI